MLAIRHCGARALQAIEELVFSVFIIANNTASTRCLSREKLTCPSIRRRLYMEDRGGDRTHCSGVAGSRPLPSG